MIKWWKVDVCLIPIKEDTLIHKLKHWWYHWTRESSVIDWIESQLVFCRSKVISDLGYRLWKRRMGI